MSVGQIEAIIERLQRSASVQSVYGDPIERDDRTVVPVARVAYGFGGGFGQSHNIETPDSDSEGGGLGGGSIATPVGALEITDENTRFVRVEPRKRSVALLLVGAVTGLLVGRRTTRRSDRPER